MPVLDKRAYCYWDMNDNYRCRYSAWDNWIRWVVLGVIIVAFLLLFCLCSCISARRRRRTGRNPFWGTGWAGGRTAPGHGAPQYSANPYYQQPYSQQYGSSPPQYTPSNGGYYGANQGYYGQQNGVELQNQPASPQPAYTRAGDQVYEPPAGPPPAKNDSVIR